MRDNYIDTKIKNFISQNQIEILFSLVFSLLISWFVKGLITPVLFWGKGFDGRDLFFKLLLFSFYTIVITPLSFIFVLFLKKIFPKSTFQGRQIIENWNNSLINDTKKRINFAFLVFSLGICIIFFINNLLSSINIKTWHYEVPQTIPTMSKIGGDFREGLYLPATNLKKSGFTSIGPDGTYPSIYPPLVNVLSLPYTLFDIKTAYLFHVRMLFWANILCLAMATLLVKEIYFAQSDLEKGYLDLLVILIFLLMSLYTLSGYPFAFSMERGNIDIFALFFSMLSIWVLLKNPQKIWLQIILLSIAVHIKIYPAALFALIFYKHGKKTILPLLVVNLGFLFILGPQNAISFIQNNFAFSGERLIKSPMNWVGDHGAISFAWGLAKYYKNYFPIIPNLWIIFLLNPIILWASAVLTLIRRRYQPQYAVLLFMISVPIMDLVPPISHDYKLVILSPVIILLIGLIIKMISQKQSWFDFLQLIFLLIIILLIGRPYTMGQNSMYDLEKNSSFLINNKYLWSFTLEAIMAINIFRIIAFDKPNLEKQSKQN